MRNKNMALIIITVLIIVIVVFILFNNNEGLTNKRWIRSEVWGDTDLDPADIYFIQIGSNCGDTTCAGCGEPIWEDCKKNMWSGIVVEPIPEIYNKLKKNYSYNKNVKAIQCAVYDRNGIEDFYVDNDLKAEANSFLISHVKKHRMKTTPIKVQTYTLNTFWDKYVHNNKVDILNLDCEGVDHIIILSTDFDKLNPKPKYILYESYHIPQNERASVLKHLNKYNYQVVSTTQFDTLVKLLPY